MSVTRQWPLAFISIHVALVMKYAYTEWDKSANGVLSIHITLSNVPSACHWIRDSVSGTQVEYKSR